MPANNYFRTKLLRIVAQESPVIRQLLLSRFSPGYRVQADAQIKRLLADGVFVSTGVSRRGLPEKIEISPSFPKARCTICFQEATMRVNPIRARLIDIVVAQAATRRALSYRLSSRLREQTDDQIGLLLSDGVFISTNGVFIRKDGVRRRPEKIELSPVFPKQCCMLCLQEIADVPKS